jgi:ketosteroid isomerase-like protein
MDDVDAFLSTVIPRLRNEVLALHSGDAAPRKVLWSHHDPVTLFGAEMSRRGWVELEPAFDRLAASFSGGESCEYEVLGAGVSGGLGYVVAIERSVAASGGRPPVRYALRVTTVFRREDGDRKVVHRHGDPYGQSARDALTSRAEEGVLTDGHKGADEQRRS